MFKKLLIIIPIWFLMFIVIPFVIFENEDNKIMEWVSKTGDKLYGFAGII